MQCLGVDLHRAVRRRDLPASHRRANRRRVGALGRRDCVRPQMHANVAGLDRVGDDPLGAVSRLVTLDECAVLRAVDAHEVTRSRVIADNVLDGEAALAAQMLRDYLFRYRRENTLPEWSLRNTTAADDAWPEYYARLPRVTSSTQAAEDGRR